MGDNDTKANKKRERKTVHFRIGKKQFDWPAGRLVWIGVSALLVVLIVVGGIFAYRVFFAPQSFFTSAVRQEEPDATQSEEPAVTSTATEEPSPSEPEEPQPPPSVDPYDQLKQVADQSILNTDIVNVVLVGVDHAFERDEWRKKYYYSDVMMVLAINFKENKVDMISVPRDTYTPIYKTKGRYKLNSSFYWGGGREKKGYEYVLKSIETVFGGNIAMDYYIGVDMPAIKKLVDAIGGVDYEVDLAFKIQGRVMKKGMQHLDGQAVLDYLRARHKTSQTSDLQRVDRQKKLLLEVFKQLKSSKQLANLPKIVQALAGEVDTNLTFEQLCALAVFGASLDEKSIKMHTMPGKYAYMIYNWNYVILNDKDRIKLVKSIYGNVKVPSNSKYYNMTNCKNEWARMQARGFVKIANSQVGKQEKLEPEKRKITDEQLADLKAKTAALNSVRSSSYKKINAAIEALKKAFSDAGIKVSWYVNENPGLPRLTG